MSIENFNYVGLSAWALITCISLSPKPSARVLEGAFGIVSVGLLMGTSVNALTEYFLNRHQPKILQGGIKGLIRESNEQFAKTSGWNIGISTVLVLTVRVVYMRYG